ncbi:hypothetical protein LCGC14_1291940 [marine sediment metagenome]|uniref:Uncharacterized protein n=1 Tax=marine sediment metagenome TaxID=412755 RepID=A0A0F9N8L1_9ZZZZ
MITHLPMVLYGNKITEVLYDIRYNYGKLTRKGYIYGLIAISDGCVTNSNIYTIKNFRRGN